MQNEFNYLCLTVKSIKVNVKVQYLCLIVINFEIQILFVPSKHLFERVSPVGVLIKAALGTIFTSSSISAITDASLSSSFIKICNKRQKVID